MIHVFKQLAFNHHQGISCSIGHRETGACNLLPLFELPSSWVNVSTLLQFLVCIYQPILCRSDMDANQYKSDLKRSNRFGSPSTSRVSSPSYPYFLNQSTRSKFIGSFIHEYNVDSRVKHRPSKRARQRIRKRLAKLELDDNGGSKASPESGYETTSGDCQTPGFASPALNKTSFKLPEDSHNKAKRDSNRPRSVEGSLPSAKDDNGKHTHSFCLLGPANDQLYASKN